MDYSENVTPHPSTLSEHRQDAPAEQRVLASFLYHADLSYRKTEPFVNRCYGAIRQWLHRYKHLFGA